MILLAYGTRPEYIKLKSLIHEFDINNFSYLTLFTGQHKDLIGEHNPDYIINMDDFNDLHINRLDKIVKSIMGLFTKICLNKDIDYVLVQGDTTSAMAVALSAFHHGIKVIHLEAGLRTYVDDMPYPEERNRRIISALADVHLCPTKIDEDNLHHERLNMRHGYVVGNTVIDNLLSYKNKCEYTNKILITLHRRENHFWIDQWFIEINKLAIKYPEYEFILPIHPNPNVKMHRHLLTDVNVIDPLPYNEMLDLLVKTRLVITDSGGLQEECSFLNKKCLTCRIVTERPEAIGQSTFMVLEPSQLAEIFKVHIENPEINYECPFGDGHSAEKIYEILKRL